MKKKKRNKKRKLSYKIKLIKVTLVIMSLVFGANIVYQIYKKPTELISYAMNSLWSAKSPRETWASYRHSFKSYQTSLVAAEFLAGLAQVESTGRPIASPEWKWNANFSNFFAPASSAVGLMQFTNATFDKANKFCLIDGKIKRARKGFFGNPCWGNWFHTRLSADTSIELAAINIHQNLQRIPRQYRRTKSKREKLSAIIHLCGPQKAKSIAANLYKRLPSLRCGSHSAGRYTKDVLRWAKYFKRL